MLKKISLAVVAMFIMAMVSTSVFAQGLPAVTLTDADIQAFLTVYDNPDPTAVAQAAATQADPMHFAAASTKISAIYTFKKAGQDDAAIKAATASTIPISDEDLAAFSASADKITEVLDKFTAAAMGAAPAK
jgi:hypothetical protein